MRPGKIENHTAKFGAPEGVSDKDVLTLFIRSEQMGAFRFMRSAWFPDNDEIKAIVAGAPILLGISSPNAHPIVNMGVGEIPGDDLPDAAPAPAADEITFAKVGGPPADWARLDVIDAATGQIVDADVIECDTVKGYIIALKRDADGNLIVGKDDKIETVRIEGRYQLRRREAE